MQYNLPLVTNEGYKGIPSTTNLSGLLDFVIPAKLTTRCNRAGAELCGIYNL